MKRRVYRDRQTGRFVKKTTWTRSKAQGGTRYVRQGGTAKAREKARKRAPKRKGGERLSQEFTEYQVNVRYKHRAAAAVEVQVSAQGPAGATRRDVLEALRPVLALLDATS